MVGLLRVPVNSLLDAEWRVMTTVVVHILHRDMKGIIFVHMLDWFEVLLNVGSVKIVIKIEVGCLVRHNESIFFLVRVVVFL